MKLRTSLLLGGLTGAAVVMIMRNNRAFAGMANGWGSMLKQRLNDAKETAIEKGIGVKFAGGLPGIGGKSGASGSARGDSRSGGLEQVGQLASKDPQVKHQVNEILEESSQHRI